MKRQVSSVLFMGLSVAAGIIAVLMMFLPAMKMMNGTIYSGASLFWDSSVGDRQGIWITFVAYMLVLASAIATLVVSLPFISLSYRLEKLILGLSIALSLVGAILIGLTQVFYCLQNNCMDRFANYTTLAGPYVAIAFILIQSAMNIVAIELDNI